MHAYVYIISFRIYLICDNVESRAEKFASMCISRAESQNKEALVVTSVVTTIQWFYACVTSTITDLSRKILQNILLNTFPYRVRVRFYLVRIVKIKDNTWEP